jgi:DNA polymerase III subunit delta'
VAHNGGAEAGSGVPAPDHGLAGALERHPHARAVLAAAAARGGSPSHAYLFHGPPGAGKRSAARAFAAALLAPDSEAAAERVLRGAHPDLTWVTPSGASELLVSDIDGPVVSAATRTPFESARRVFVIEAAGAMNDQAANRLLKTLEEPPELVHLILLAEHIQDVLPTIASRCQPVRFDPLIPEQLERRLLDAHGERLDAARAAACARLACGDALFAELLAGDEGQALRASAEGLVRTALGGATRERAWGRLLAAARQAGEQAAARVAEQLSEQAELLARTERRKHEREAGESARRAERRARASALDRGLRLVELWLRDAWCHRLGVPELALAVDRSEELSADARAHSADSLRAGVELVADARLRLGLNVSEELVLEALAYRLEVLASAAIGPRSGSIP